MRPRTSKSTAVVVWAVPGHAGNESEATSARAPRVGVGRRVPATVVSGDIRALVPGCADGSNGTVTTAVAYRFRLITISLTSSRVMSSAPSPSKSKRTL